MSDNSDKKTRLGTPVSGSGSHSSIPSNAPPPAPAAQTPAPLPANVPAAGSPAMPPPADPFLGKTLVNRYYIERKLGEGGMGSVYKAVHTTLEKPVALKILHHEFCRKADLVERFLQEAKAASKIRHENVIDITDFGQTPDGSVFFAMEFLKGRDLHDEIARAKLSGQYLPWERTRKIFMQTCAALSAAHKKGIIHRDLKPENIYLVEWLGHKDFVKLLDFGIAKMTDVSDDDGARKLTKTGMLFGTPEYMSPEQARGEKVDHRVDIYAMGCILYQLIVGKVPFEADNFMSTLSLHLSVEPPPVPAEAFAATGAPAGLQAVIDKALHKDRDQRFSTIDELMHAVDVVCDGGALPAPGEGVPAPQQAHEQTPQSGRKGPAKTHWEGAFKLDEDGQPAQQAPSGGNKTMILVIAAVAVVAVVVGGVLLTRGGGKSDNAAQAASHDNDGVAAPNNGKPPAATIPTEVGLALDTTPAGAKVVDIKSGSVLGTTPLNTKIAGSTQPRQVRFELDGYQSVVYEFVPKQDVSHKATLVAKQGTGNGKPSKPTVKIGKPDHKKPVIKKPVVKKPVVKKPDDKKPVIKKPVVKKPDDKKPDDGTGDPKLKNPFGNKKKN